MKQAVSSKHRQAIKTIQFEKKCFKIHLIRLKLEKCIDKHATSKHQKMITNTENLLVRLLL